MSREKAREFLKSKGLEDRILVTEADTSTVVTAAAAFGVKARMIPPDRVEALVGHAPGGVCPFGILPGVRVWLDGSLRRHDRVYPAAGDGHTAVDLTVEELEYAADPLGWVDVTKDPAAE